MKRERIVFSESDLVALVPYQLGFVPTDSVVVVALESSGEVMVMARLDVLPFSDRPRAVHGMTETLAHHSPASALVIAYGDEDAEAQAAAQALSLEAAGIPVPSGLVCANGQWRLLGSQDWHPVNPAGAGVVEAVADGRSPMPSRAAKIALLSALAPSSDLAAALDSPPIFSGVMAARAWAKVLNPDEGEVSDLDVDTLVTAVTALEVVSFRDLLLSVLAGFSSATAFGAALAAPVIEACPSHRQAVERLAALYRITPSTKAAAPLCAVVAAAAWVIEGTALAFEAVERALTCDPSHELARLIADCLVHGVDPRGLLRTGMIAND